MKIRGYPIITKLERYLSRLNRCTCGSHNLSVDNTDGWTGATIRCRDCKRIIHGAGVDEAIKNWNKSFQRFVKNETNK